MTDNAPPASTTSPARNARFLLIVLALHVPLFIYPVLRLAGWLEAPGWLTLLVAVPITLSQVLARTWLRHHQAGPRRYLKWLCDFLLGLSPLVLMPLLVAEALVVTGTMEPRSAALMVLAVAASATAWSLYAAAVPMVKTVRLTSAKLARPLRFVQITDVHIGSRSARFLAGLMRRITSLEPEFLAITGDFIDATGVPVADLASLQQLPVPIYFSIGNHERYEDLDDINARLQSLGVQVLRGAMTSHRQDVTVIGIDDRDDALQVQRGLARLDLPQDEYLVLLYHRPRGLEAAAEHGVDLMLSGHTHNGQIFPFNLVVNSVFSMSQGLFEQGAAKLYVSQGTGTWGPVMRFGTRAEITLFEVGTEEEKHVD